MDRPKRYHPALVTLHWVIALFVFTDLYIGYFYIRPILLSRGGGVRGTDPLLQIHMAVGVAILVLLVVRFAIRLLSKRPAPADAGNQWLNLTARFVHYALYFFVFAMTLIGLIFSLQTDRFQVAFLGATQPAFGSGGGFPPAPESGTPRAFPTPGPGTPVPNFEGGPGFTPGSGPRPPFRRGFNLAFLLLPLHLDISIILIALLSLHILAAAYHQFIRKDHLLSRMWFGAR
jgi:cytochrome b561